MNIHEINTALSAVKRGERKEVVKRYALAYGCSEATIYRQLNKLFGKKKEIEKVPVIDPENSLVNEVARIKLYGMQGIHQRELSTELCLKMLAQQGFELADKVSPATVNRRLKRQGFRDTDPIVRVESRYANQTHQMDFSRSKYFQVKRYDSVANDYLLTATNKQLTYKEHDTLLRTWIVGLTDTYSRLSLSQMYVATGESVLIGIEFMNFCYTREDAVHPLLFLPDKIKTDNGAMAKNESFKMLLAKLQVGLELSKPMKHRGIQKRESQFRTLWQRYELPLYAMLTEGKTIHLNDYNALMHEFVTGQMEDQHPVRKAQTKGHVYQASIVMREQRKVDIDMRLLLERPYIRTIDDTLCISINNQLYQHTNPKTIGAKVKAWINANGDVIAELVEEPGKPFIMTPTEGFVYEGDFSNRHPAGYRQQIDASLKEQGKGIFYMPVREKKLNVTARVDEAVEAEAISKVFASEFEAKKYIASQFGRSALYSRYAEIFDPLLADTLKQSDIDTVIEQIKTKRVAL